MLGPHPVTVANVNTCNFETGGNVYTSNLAMEGSREYVDSGEQGERCRHHGGCGAGDTPLQDGTGCVGKPRGESGAGRT